MEKNGGQAKSELQMLRDCANCQDGELREPPSPGLVRWAIAQIEDAKEEHEALELRIMALESRIATLEDSRKSCADSADLLDKVLWRSRSPEMSRADYTLACGLARVLADTLN